MLIGSLQNKEIESLRKVLGELDLAVGRDSRGVFSRLREKLDEWCARVSVIGQVKAGKSSFLNALIGDVGFLPSDVNPWTSVVTNLRINMPNDPIQGASFAFFDEEAWDHIIHGNPETRKLAQTLLPGFDTSVLKQQTEEMRDRAKKRLGRHYEALLGTTHDFDFLSHELLQRYVCAGPADEEMGDREAVGRYATITREANIYLRLPEFAVPTIVTDTPGVNDPFLVRDEFTCQSLDKSDVFIVVLSAHQPLTEVDVALMRMLSSDRRKNLVIFINRIDELEDFDTQLDRVVSDVTDRLTAAMPDAQFSIHAGSAYFAELALRQDEEARVMRDELDQGLIARFLETHYGRVPESQTDRFLLASGLEDVKGTLSNIIDHGVGLRQLNALCAELRSEIGAIMAVSKRERDSVRQQVEAVSNRDASDFLEEIRTEVTQLGRLRDRLEEQFDGTSNQVDKVIGKAAASLQKVLDEAVTGFVAERRDQIASLAAMNQVRKAAKGSVDIDMLPLSLAVESEITQHFQRFRAATDVMLSNCLEASCSIAAERFEGVRDGISLTDLPHDQFLSIITLQKKLVSVDLLTNRSWAFWKRPEVNVDKTFESFRVIAMAELVPWVQKLVHSFSEALIERVIAGKERIQIVGTMVDKSIDERERRLKADAASLERLGIEPGKADQIAHRLQSRIEVLERRLKILAINESSLSRSALAMAA